MKICPNCGNHLKGNEVFCPNCGYDLLQSDNPRSNPPTSTANDRASDSSDRLGLNSYFNHLERKVVSDQPARSQFSFDDHSFDHQKSSSNRQMTRPSPESRTNYEQPNNTAQGSPIQITNYFSWWWQTLLHPAKSLIGNWYFSLISFVINYLLWILSFRGLMGRFNSLINSFFNGRISVDNAMFENADQSWWGLVVIGLLAWFSYWLLGFGFRKLHHQLDFWRYSNRLAALTNLALPLSLVMLVLTELGLFQLAIVFFIAIVIVDMVGLVVSIVVPDRNRLYLATLAVGLVPFVVVVIFTCIVQIMG